MKQISRSLVIVCLLLFLSLGIALAGGEMLPRSLVSGGGGIVNQGELWLHTAIGQTAVGAVQNNLTLCSGYLCGAGAPPVSEETHALYLPIVLNP